MDSNGHQKKAHLAELYVGNMDVFLCEMGLVPMCREYRATYLTGLKEKVTCKRCLALMAELEQRLKHWYEIVYYAWSKELRNRVIPDGFVPPAMQKLILQRQRKEAKQRQRKEAGGTEVRAVSD